jgi:inorganic pyrophosphatase
MTTPEEKAAVSMQTIEVCIEWPTGGEVVRIEIEADATDDEIKAAASDAFFNLCNYGWSKVDGSDAT